MNDKEKSFCVKCGLETDQKIFNLKETVPFCSWCYQAFLGNVRGDTDNHHE